VKSSVMVGVVGYPNVGKSSLINSLKRTKVVGVSPVAGFTKSVAEVVLDKQVRLLDSPGVVFDDSDQGAVLLRNCLSPDTLEDPTPAVQALLERVPPTELMVLYAIPSFDPNDSHTFLAHVARKKGKLRRGGIPDLTATAKAVLKDWNTGKVKFYTAPPEDEAHLEGLEGEAQILSSFAPEFNPQDMMEQDTRLLSGLAREQEQQQQEQGAAPSFVPLPPSAISTSSTLDHLGQDHAQMEDEGESKDLDGVEESDSGESTSMMEDELTNPAKPVDAPKISSSLLAMQEAHGNLNPQINQNTKKKLKMEKKKQRKNVKRAMSKSMQDDDYDFGQDFRA